MRKSQQGFTLIELVVVITILGILAAFAIPRFAALDSAARVAATSAMVGTLRSAAALAHAQYLVAGNSPASVTLEGTTVSLTNGYPDATATGIQAAIQDSSGFTPTLSGSTLTYTKTGAATPATCIATYTASAAANTAPVIETATLATDTAGC
jgi:MSHA pilin protein MshA